MLTPAQRKVKQELEELQLKAPLQPKDEEPSPLKSHRRKWFYMMGVIFAFFISIFILQDLFSTSQDEIVSYLKMEQAYYNQSSNLLNGAIEQDSASLKQASEKQAVLVQKVKKLKAPAELRIHKQYLLDVMQHRLDLITYLAETPHRDTFQVNKALLKLKVSQGLAAERLTTAFDREKIKYIEQEDGTIEYWVDTKTYRYHF
ncbi:hypothetical protein QE429_001136 [Bacillus sp. SORGH_AS 510]|uniref:hypothetical protein n=1 Tax=Bacillus sp. SORGH_AS_0510 TaxID=3041771 RepID=UPI002785C839|nr:hypothetical protein [Bacillus sp. SORGH_AS_0510]MDQ1144309.1 hypothetical protein [Bacillus sp. SORGH_AS_0510]